MKYFFTLFILSILFLGCSTTEVTMETKEVKEETSSIPAWYNERITSVEDSLALHGFALASSPDSTQALFLARETSTEYLRFEIDRYAEDLRVKLSELPSGNGYASQSFILQLRNTVRKFSLDGAEFDHKFELSGDGIYYVYARSTFPKNDLPHLFEEYISDTLFINEL